MVLSSEHLTFSLLFDPSVDLCSALLRSTDEIDGLQVSLVVLLCGVQESLKPQRTSVQSDCGVQCVLGVNPSPTERKFAVLSP